MKGYGALLFAVACVCLIPAFADGGGGGGISAAKGLASTSKRKGVGKGGREKPGLRLAAASSEISEGEQRKRERKATRRDDEAMAALSPKHSNKIEKQMKKRIAKTASRRVHEEAHLPQDLGRKTSKEGDKRRPKKTKVKSGEKQAVKNARGRGNDGMETRRTNGKLKKKRRTDCRGLDESFSSGSAGSSQSKESTQEVVSKQESCKKGARLDSSHKPRLHLGGKVKHSVRDRVVKDAASDYESDSTSRAVTEGSGERLSNKSLEASDSNEPGSSFGFGNDSEGSLASTAGLGAAPLKKQGRIKVGENAYVNMVLSSEKEEESEAMDLSVETSDEEAEGEGEESEVADGADDNLDGDSHNPRDDDISRVSSSKRALAKPRKVEAKAQGQGPSLEEQQTRNTVHFAGVDYKATDEEIKSCA